MENISENFAKFLAKSNAVRFGEFILKSGRKSNIFFDLGQLFYGNEFIKLGEYYADFLVQNSLQNVDVLFGPAYKGINIVIVTTMALYRKHDLLIPITYNRKIPKDHAEKGNFVGFDLSNAKTVLILDDVITDGGTKYEAINMLSQFPQLEIKGIVIGVDRQEVNEKNERLLEIFKANTGLDVFVITTKENVFKLR